MSHFFSGFPRGEAVKALVLLVFVTPSASASEEPLFVEAPESFRFDFSHRNGMSGQYYFHEMMGPGVALLDYDNDGDLDVYLVQGHELIDDGPAAEEPSDRLLRNDLDENGLRFTDVTAEAGIDIARGYGMGVATGDIDNDGWVDIYLTNWGANQLLRNMGPDSSGRVRFEDMTERAKAGDRSWSVSASLLDYDRDGWLDLFVANYVVFELAIHKPCRNYMGAPDYCSPLAYGEAPDRLLRNLGEGLFRDVTEGVGLGASDGAGLGVVAGDFDGDGWTDLYVANDQSANQLWINEDGRSFSDQALLAGTAVNAEGRAEAGMGVAAGDIDSDGDEDLLVSHLDRETNTLYLNQGGGFFDDTTSQSGMARASWDSTGFGILFLDIDNDGHLDVAVANGAVKHLEALVRAKDPFPLHQPNQLFRGLGGGRFEDWSAAAGPAFQRSEVSRGLARGDIDNDGDDDLVVANNHGPARLLLNQIGQDNPWLGLRLVERNRDAVGAKVRVEVRAAAQGSEGGATGARRIRTLHRSLRTDGSYASASDPRILIGLGQAGGSAAQGAKVEVTWGDGGSESFEIEGIGRYMTLRRGEGKAGAASETVTGTGRSEAP